MTLRPLSFDFPLMSAMSRRPPFIPGLDGQLIELDDEIARRRSFYRYQIQQGRMTEADARRHIAIFAAILEDTRWRIDCPALDGEPFRSARARHEARAAELDQKSRLHGGPFSWDDKVRELRRELAIRARKYPNEIAHNRLSEDTARLRMERLEAVHWRYWIDGEGWDQVAPEDSPAARRAKARAFTTAVDQWLHAAHRAGNPAVKGYLTPDQLAWHEARAQAAAALNVEQAA